MSQGIQEETLRAMLDAGTVRKVLVSQHDDIAWASLTAVRRFA